VHNSHLPFDPLFVFLTVWLWPLTFCLILIDGRGIVMDYPCVKFGDFSFSRFGFIVRTDRQTDRQTQRITESQTPLNAFLTRLSLVWVISLREWVWRPTRHIPAKKTAVVGLELGVGTIPNYSKSASIWWRRGDVPQMSESRQSSLLIYSSEKMIFQWPV